MFVRMEETVHFGDGWFLCGMVRYRASLEFRRDREVHARQMTGVQEWTSEYAYVLDFSAVVCEEYRYHISEARLGCSLR